jgi:general secretion pathway protein D
MITLPIAQRILRLFICTSSVCLVSPATLRAGSDGGSSVSSVEAQAEFEIARRRDLAGDFAPQAMQRGTGALAVRDYEKAFSEYRAALDAIPDAPEVRELHKVALDGFTKSAMGLAEQRIAEGRWEDAQTTVECLLQPQYNPSYKPAQRLLQRLESPDYFNKTVTPGFVSKVEQVKKLLIEAQGLHDSGRFNDAANRYEEVLRIDRYNIAARRGMEQVNVSRTRVADAAYNDTRAAMITEVDRGWETPIKRKGLGSVAITEQSPIYVRGTQSVENKLRSINIPRINFVETTVRQAIEYLSREAAANDQNSEDPGVNIVLKLDPAAEEAIIYELQLNNVSLEDALASVTGLANLKMRVDPYAVLIVPATEATDPLMVREFRVPANFLSSSPSAAPDGGSSVDGVALSSDAKQFLIERGVSFDDPESSATYMASSSRLVVRNTQANMDVVESIVYQAEEEKPLQVEIETKFVEVSQNNLKELGFDWLLGQFAFPGGSGVYGGGGTVGDQINNSQNFPFNYPGTGPAGSPNNPLVPVGINPLTAGNRTGAAAITANAVDALLLGNPVTGPASGILSLAGIFTNPQFQVVLRALNQKKGIDLLSAPKVTAKSGGSARVEVVREFLYPNEYSPPEVPQTTCSGTQPVTPATPVAFDKKDIGVILNVEPTVGPDRRTIDLSLTPEVTEFEGFINYGSPILNRGIVVTENVINYPVFSQRKVETAVSIYDGQTVVLGGLIREDVQKVTDKTPILGDIPLAGALFRSQADQHIKRNLIIFVTANLMDPSGQPLAAAAQLAEQTADLAGLPSPLDGPVEPPLP